MSYRPRAFVSYTTRGGDVSPSMLLALRNRLSEFCIPFVDLLITQPRYPQLNVILELWKADLLILVESPLADTSPWVRFELLFAKLKLIPVLKLKLEDIHGSPSV